MIVKMKKCGICGKEIDTYRDVLIIRVYKFMEQVGYFESYPTTVKHFYHERCYEKGCKTHTLEYEIERTKKENELLKLKAENKELKC